MRIFEDVRRRRDSSYVITLSGNPYHVPNAGEFAELWVEVNDFALANPDLIQEDDEDVAE